MPFIDLGDLDARRTAVEEGYIWSAPREAVMQALEDIAAGRIEPPDYIPMQWTAIARELSVPEGTSEGGGL